MGTLGAETPRTAPAYRPMGARDIRPSRAGRLPRPARLDGRVSHADIRTAHGRARAAPAARTGRPAR